MGRPDGSGAPGRAATIRASLALVLASVRYRVSVAGEARRGLAGWERRAQAIGDPRLRDMALSKLRDERLNAEGAGMLATLAPRAHRSAAARAMMALQVLYDYLDGVSESDAGADAGLYEPFTGAFIAGGGDGRVDEDAPADGGYAKDLAATVRAALAQLPAAERTAQVLVAGAERCAQAQLRVHAIPRAGVEQARMWAQECSEGALHWQETLAGSAARVVGLHAVIAAAADERTTTAQAEAIDGLYLAISAVTTLLDGVVDRPRDLSAREPGLTSLYESDGALAEGLARAARQAVADSAEVPHGAFHLTMLAGIVSYYATAEGARSDYARPLIATARGALGPLVALTSVVWKTWRAAHDHRHARRTLMWER
jgi:tetraprenyl-beta-curcumene synthase